MIISSSSVSLHSSHTERELNEKREQLTVWNNGQDGDRISRPTDNTAATKDWNPTGTQLERVGFSSAAAEQPRYVRALVDDNAAEQTVMGDLKLMILKALVERLTGKKINIVDPSKFSSADNNVDHAHQESFAQSENPGQVPEEGWGLIYEYHERHYESEQTTFSAAGTVTTSDGKEIAFSVELAMSREFASEQNISIRAGDALKDPLVINFDGTAADLTEKTFSFDIDSDGMENQIHFLAPGSGFLALDRNKDGVINDGKELFGAMTGNGFAELAGYDEDQNGWIDENDSIFEKLRIWALDSDGNRQLFALGAKGIGAIYLGNTSTPFSLKNEQNDRGGEIRSSGVFLFENGTGGTVQQIDLVA